MPLLLKKNLFVVRRNLKSRKIFTAPNRRNLLSRFRSHVFITPGRVSHPEVDRSDNCGEACFPDVLEEEQTNTIQLHLIAYFHAMFLTCCTLNSPYHISQRRLLIQKILFSTIAAISTLEAFAQVKTLIILQDGSLGDCILLGKQLSRCCVILSFIIASVCYKSQIQNILQTLYDERHLLSVGGSSNKVYWATGLAVSYALLRSSIVTLQSFFDWDEWNLGDLIENKAYELGHVILAWNKKNSNYTTHLLRTFSSGVNVQTILYASLVSLFQLVGEFHEQILKGCLLAMSLTLYIGCEAFSKELISSIQVDRDIPYTIWRKYKLLQNISKEFNSIFGIVFYFFHADSFLCGAYFLSEVIDFNIVRGLVVYLLFDIAKIACCYCLLAASTCSNDTFREWVMERFSDTERIHIGKVDSNLHIRTIVLLHELDSNPIGIKTSNILINSAFIVQFVGVVVYYFLLLVDAADASTCESLIQTLDALKTLIQKK